MRLRLHRACGVVHRTACCCIRPCRHSAPNSTYIHHCPNTDACRPRAVRSDSTAMVAGQAAAASSTASPLQACQAAWYASSPPGEAVLVAYWNDRSSARGNGSAAASGGGGYCLLWDVPADDPASSYMQHQCAEGYTGNLCGEPSPTWNVDAVRPCTFACTLACTTAGEYALV